MENNKKEVRAFHSDGIELRKANDTPDDFNYVDGIGVVYDREEELWDGYFESIDKEAFRECLAKNPEIKSFFNHDANYVLSTTSSNPPLQLADMGDGLFFSSPIPDTSYGRDLKTNLALGNIRGASFTFTVDKDDVTVDKNGHYHRRILRGTIYEIGPVTNPAYVSTHVSLRDKDALLEDAQARTAVMGEAHLKEMRDKENEYRRNLISLLEIDN